MDLLDNYMAMDFNPLNVMGNLTSYSFNAKHVLNPQDLHDFITPVSWKQQSPMPAPHDHSVLGSINHYPDNIIVGHDAGNITNIVIDSHALASHHHHSAMLVITRNGDFCFFICIYLVQPLSLLCKTIPIQHREMIPFVIKSKLGFV